MSSSQNPSNPSSPLVVLFDLGGVLERVTAAADIDAWSMGKVPAGEFWTRWLASESVDLFESGRISADEFAARLIPELGLELDAEEFLEAFPRWLAGPFDGAADLVRDVRRLGLKVASFSNSNSIHWPIMERHQRTAELFDANFPSHQLGRCKPRAEAFAEVVARLDVQASRILFLDDNEVNCQAARQAGLVAFRAQGVVGARKALAEAGLPL